MVEWSEAPQYILDIATRIIERHHPELQEARIAFVLRSEAPRTNGRVTLGKASKVSPMAQVHIPFDYIIWIAADQWGALSTQQREALIDHELCHLQWSEGVAKIRGHDVEEFTEIIARYGYWWPESDEFEIAVNANGVRQATLGIPPSPDEPPRQGSVGTIDFSRIAKDVAEGMTRDGVETEFRVAGERED